MSERARKQSGKRLSDKAQAMLYLTASGRDWPCTLDPKQWSWAVSIELGAFLSEGMHVDTLQDVHSVIMQHPM